MICYALNKNAGGVVTPVHNDNMPIERVCNFHFLELNVKENISWKAYIGITAMMITIFFGLGILNRLIEYLYFVIAVQK